MIKAIGEIQKELVRNYSRFKEIQNNDIAHLHAEVNYVASVVAKKHGLDIRINFPNAQDIEESIKGEKNISIIVEAKRKDFKIPLEDMKSAAKEMMEGCQIHDFENERGFHVIFDGGKVSLFPGSIHMWCKIKDVENFLQWLLDKAY